MSHNSFGHLFRFTTFGESHGPAIGCVVDGMPPGLPVDEADIQYWLDRRKPGGSRFVTQRKEPDTVRVLSGVFEGMSTGTPIALLIENADQRSKDYDAIKSLYRPGHADFTYLAKYGRRDHRGGGRSSARETATRVAAGALARRVLGEQVKVRAALVRIGDRTIDYERWDWDAVEQNPFWCPDPQTAQLWEGDLDAIRKEGSSIGAVVELRVTGIPAGLGSPIYDKLDSELARAMMTINASKGVEIGAGFGAVALRGEENADEMSMENGEIQFASNNAGGILGGISTGQEIIVRVAFKPTSSILIPRQTIDVDGNPAQVVTKGRHDPCVGIRGAPVVEAMGAVVLADQFLRHRAQCGGPLTG